MCKDILNKWLCLFFLSFLAVIPNTALQPASLQWLSNGPSPWKGKTIRIIWSLLLNQTEHPCHFEHKFFPSFLPPSPRYPFFFFLLANLYEAYVIYMPSTVRGTTLNKSNQIFSFRGLIIYWEWQNYKHTPAHNSVSITQEIRMRD